MNSSKRYKSITAAIADLSPKAEARAVTQVVSNGAGAYSAGFVSALVDGGKLAKFCNQIVVKAASAVVDVLSPTVALPVGSVPGTIGTASDSTAVLTGTALTLKPWHSTLSVSQGALLSGSFAAQYPGIVARAFGGAIDKAVCVGTGAGSDMLGVFVADNAGIPAGSDVVCAGAGAPKLADLVNIVEQVLALGADPATTALILNPTFIKNCLVETTAGMTGLQIELATKGSIGGIQVVGSSYAPSATVAGSYVAVAIDLQGYALVMHQAEPEVDSILTAGTDGVTFDAWVYMQGKPLVGNFARRLKTV